MCGRFSMKVIFFLGKKIVSSKNAIFFIIFCPKRKLVQFLEVESGLDTTLTYRLPHLQTMSF
jgi:hypothetical protein